MMKQKIKNIKTDSRMHGKKGFWVHCVVMLVLVLIVYWQYLTGQKTYIFTDVATDSAGQTYPGLVYQAREISAGNIVNRWNFVSSIGNTAEMILPKLANIEAYFGAEQVGYFMGLFMAVKVFLSGVFFYLYLKKMEISDTASSIFSLFYAFCAHMIIRGTWRSYPNEVLTFAIWLYAYEAWFRDRKNWWKLILASAFLYFNSSGYSVVLYTGIFAVYTIFRAIVDWDKEWGRVRLKEVLFLPGIIVCALLVSSMGWMGSITTQLKSDRLSAGAGKLSTYDMSKLLTDLDTLKTAFYRTIGTDILGISDYHGTENFLEAPAFYCGILTIILMPAVYVRTKGIKKIAYSIGIAGAVLYICVKPVRFLANGLSGHSFKLASLWVMVLMLYIAAVGFDSLIESRGKNKTILILATGIVIIILAVAGAVDGMSWLKLGITIGFFILYTVIMLWHGSGKIKVVQVKNIILFIAVAEVLFTSYGCVNNRDTMEENLYEDGTIEAVAYIDGRYDGEEAFYRVEKDYQAMSYCDSLYQGYMGTVGYIGGSGDRKSTGDFYNAVSMAVLGGNNHNMTGFWVSTPVSSAMNVQYALSKTGMNTKFGYEKIGEIEGITVYENQYAFPLGYVYDRYLTMDEYLKLPVEMRRKLLMEACVLDEEYSGNALMKTVPEISMIDMQPYEVVSDMEITENWVKLDLPQSTNGKVNLVVMDVTSNGVKSSMIEYYNQDGDAVTTYLGFADGSDKYFLEFNDPQIDRIQIFNTKQYDIEQIKVYQMPQKLYYERYIENHEVLSKNGLKIERMDCNNIWGTINSSKDGMMTFSIPYDTDWHVYIDNVEHALTPVNIAMMGTEISKGVHEVQLVYAKENKWLKYVLLGVMLFMIYSTVNRIVSTGRKKKN